MGERTRDVRPPPRTPRSGAGRMRGRGPGAGAADSHGDTCSGQGLCRPRTHREALVAVAQCTRSRWQPVEGKRGVREAVLSGTQAALALAGSWRPGQRGPDVTAAHAPQDSLQPRRHPPRPGAGWRLGAPPAAPSSVWSFTSRKQAQPGQPMPGRGAGGQVGAGCLHYVKPGTVGRWPAAPPSRTSRTEAALPDQS